MTVLSCYFFVLVHAGGKPQQVGNEARSMPLLSRNDAPKEGETG
jgi:hypothetical protein